MQNKLKMRHRLVNTFICAVLFGLAVLNEVERAVAAAEQQGKEEVPLTVEELIPAKEAEGGRREKEDVRRFFVFSSYFFRSLRMTHRCNAGGVMNLMP